MNQKPSKSMTLDAFLVVLLLLGVSTSVSAQHVVVQATACPFFAGQDIETLNALYPPDLSIPPEPWDDHEDLHNDAILLAGTIPPCIDVCAGDTLHISALGIWNHWYGPTEDPADMGPDGYGDSILVDDEYVNVGGISGAIAPLNTLVGVFLADAAPDPLQTPESLILGLDDMTTPTLQQSFVIGSGLNNIMVPEGATRLFLGHQDAWEWNNNFGGMVVNIAHAVDIDVKPENLNLKGKGVFTTLIHLHECYDAVDIDLSSLVCEGAQAVGAQVIGNNRLMVTFNREDLVDVSPGDAVQLVLTGELNDGTPILGADTVRIKD